MNPELRGRLAIALALALWISIQIGCGGSGGDGPSLQDIPRYPGATKGESMEGSSPGGMVHGNLAQFTTTDPFDQVLEFYTDALREYDPELMSRRSELGRQAALSIPRGNGVVSVAIQEFSEQGKVNITLMEAGS